LRGRTLLEIVGSQPRQASGLKISVCLTSSSSSQLQAAGLHKLQARTIGISVDPRRTNFSEESLARNVERLKAYRSKLVVFPKKGAKPAVADKTAAKVSAVIPLPPLAGFVEISKSDIPKSDESAYRQLRNARANKRNEGAREKRIRDKAEADSAAKK
jgi:large subunit ribosomal protein L13e